MPRTPRKAVAKKVKTLKAAAAHPTNATAADPTKAAAAHPTRTLRRTPKPPAAAKAAARPKASLQGVVLDALADMKALEIKLLDVRGLTDIADTMVIASGTSDRHVRSVAQRVIEKIKEAGFRPHGVEGHTDGDWVLIDLSAVIVHVMLPRVREFYGLEKLWDMTAISRAAVRA